MSNVNSTPCEQVLEALFLYLDHELNSEQEYQTFQVHFKECPDCNSVMLSESETLNFMKNLLRNTCNEQAPEELIDRIMEQTALLAGATGGQVEFFSSTTVTEITFDDNTSIQVTREFTQEIRHEFPDGL